MEKKTVRLEIKEKLKKLNQRELHKFHKEINSHISNSRLFLEGKVIMAYLAVPGEASVDASISTALSMGKTVCVPFILEEEGQMQAVRLVSLKNWARTASASVRPRNRWKSSLLKILTWCWFPVWALRPRATGWARARATMTASCPDAPKQLPWL